MATGLSAQDFRRAQLELGPTGASQLNGVIADSGSGGGAGVGGAINTNITTVGDGTLTDTAMIGGVITRSGSTAAFTDTTATPAELAAAVPQFADGMSWFLDIKNTTAFAETIAGASGVTLSGQTVIPPLSVGTFLVTLTSSTVATMRGVSVVPLSTLANTLDNTVTTGTGTMVSGAMEGAQLVTLTASGQAAITLTTRTAAQIQANVPNWSVGQTYRLRIVNKNTGTLTTAGGSNVTMTSTIPANCYADYTVTFATATTITTNQVNISTIAVLPPAKFVTINVTAGTLSAGDAGGASLVDLTSTNATPGSQAMRTPAQVLSDHQAAGLAIGMSYVLRIRNTGAGTFTLATDSGTGFTMTGTMTVLQNAVREFVVTINTATTGTVQDMGSAADFVPAGVPNAAVAGVAASYKIARGVHTQVAASDTVVTGLTTVVAAIANFAGVGPTVKQLFCHADIGDQSGAPAAGSILINTYKPTNNTNDVTPTAATDFSDNATIAWVAIGT